MFKIDLHTHSSASADGGISDSSYKKLLSSAQLDFIAITDHNTIIAAQRLHKAHGKQIIIGEEINSLEGELIGLFIKSLIKPGLSALATAQAIHDQGGLVYIPHPLETVRSGLSQGTLESIISEIDIMEGRNGRALFQNRGTQATNWAKLHNLPTAASSDAHGLRGIGGTYSVVTEEPTAKNLVKVLTQGHLVTKRPPLHSLLYPKYHRLRKRGRKKQ